MSIYKTCLIYICNIFNNDDEKKKKTEKQDRSKGIVLRIKIKKIKIKKIK